ncbi:orotidine-5'-phosphate decarboxylase [Vagococcus salmoninarum]|uniref:orotidine-5'-phosphate decarboxylase n=1 Tax=Vagococcus salmoninarum TaxID=2739 RepID=UPI0028D15CC9|nr:orotidine-5'-phosphate decarboxylase [Vagococcus salmoninarum]
MNRPIIALDFPNKESIITFFAHYPVNESLYVKVGMELFYQEGPAIVQWLKSLGHDVFLDLKLHDIPNTVESAMTGIAKLGVSLTNVHAAGGQKMMKAALKGLEAGTRRGEERPLLIAVTQLTSTAESEMQKDQLIPVSLLESVVHYGQMTAASGLDGVVCSALEVQAIKVGTSPNFACLTPGIRPTGSAIGDQQRIVTPGQAREIGSDYIVVGRPITQAVKPYEAYQEIKNQWNGDY